MATGPIETHLHHSFNWENAAPGARIGPRGRSVNCGSVPSAQCVRLGSEINRAVYVIDNRTMAKMLSELIRWGRHYNQAVRALNTIALFIRRGSPPEYRAFSEMLSDAEEKLAEVERGRQVIEYVLTDIAGSTSVSGD